MEIGLLWIGVSLSAGIATAGYCIGNGLDAIGDGLWRMGSEIKDGLVDFHRAKEPEDPSDNNGVGR